MTSWRTFGLATEGRTGRQQPLPMAIPKEWQEVVRITDAELAIIHRVGEFLNRHQMLVRITYGGEMCPPWANRHPFRKCSSVHGDQFRIVIQRGGKLVKFNYWNTREDMADDRRPEGEDIMGAIAGHRLPSDEKAICRVYDWFTEAEMGEMMAWSKGG